MGHAERANLDRTVEVRDDGVKLERDPSGYAIFINSRHSGVIYPRAIADSFGFTRHELGAPRIEANRIGTLIPICPRVRYACCPGSSMSWSESCKQGFSELCPHHSGPIEFIYERRVESEEQSHGEPSSLIVTAEN